MPANPERVFRPPTHSDFPQNLLGGTVRLCVRALPPWEDTRYRLVHPVAKMICPSSSHALASPLPTGASGGRVQMVTGLPPVIGARINRFSSNHAKSVL